MMFLESMGKAISEWRIVLGTAGVLAGAVAQEHYGITTLGGGERIILGALLPQTVDEVVALVKIASRYRISLYPISTGNNWGYGSASPVVDSCVVVDLSKMNRIIHVNTELGLVTVEPGVTTQQLQKYLEDNDIPFLSPVTGAGAGSSIVGNALERGRSTSALVDRFSSIAAIEVVLADGTIYSSLGKREASSRGFNKWGVGPYIDGLFGQSNFGIVTSATFALSPLPECTEGFIVSIKEDKSLSDAVESMRKALQRLGSTLPSIQIQNPQRILSRTIQYPKEHVDNNEVLSNHFIKESMKSFFLTTWTVVGTLQGERKIVKESKSVIKEIFKSCQDKSFFFNPGTLTAVDTVIKHLPLPNRLRKFRTAISMLSAYLHVSSGKTMKISILPLWQRVGELYSMEKMDLSQNGVDYHLDSHCGILFFVAVLPMIGKNVESFATEAQEICKKYHVEPILGFLNYSDRCFFADILILFDKSIHREVENARLCYKELSDLSLQCDGYPSRANIDSMHTIVNPDESFWQVVGKIKTALDPQNIMAPGRYSRSKKDNDVII